MATQQREQRIATKQEEDILRLLASGCHTGTKNLNNQMKRYTEHKTPEGIHVINVAETWQKIKLAARAIAAIDNPEDVIVVSARPYGQRAVIKFAHYTNAISTSSSRWTPGTLTNQNTKKFQEPRLLIVTDPRADRQAVIEASYVNIPCIALCDTDNSLEYIDIAIPCNNRSTESISMVYWMLAREVLVLRGIIRKDEEWSVMVDLFYHKTPEQLKGDEEEDQEQGDIDTFVGKEEEKGGKWDEAQQGQEGGEEAFWN